jgi:hypothetical protein
MPSTPCYLAATEAEAAAIGAALFEQFVAHKRLTDPEAVTADGHVIHRSPLTGELEPERNLSTGWGAPRPAVQGYFLPMPQHEAYSEVPSTLISKGFNPWPMRIDAEENALPAWVQPVGAHDAYVLGAWVTHNGYDYCSLVEANVWEPTPQSTLWRISPDPGPLPWVQPTGSMDAYSIGDKVTYTAAGRDETLWESNIDANVYVPGDDVADRWWKPITDAGPEVLPWVQPTPGTAAAPYEIEARVSHDGKTWRSLVQLNVWAPSGTGAYGWEEVA